MTDQYQGDLRSRFEVGGVEFVIDLTPGKERRPSEANSFTLVKTPLLTNFYMALGRRLQPKSILELGVFQGGSFVLLDRLFEPETMIGVELDPRFEVLAEYCDAQDRNVNVYFGTSQADETAIPAILNSEFPDGIDLVVDDASHTYEFTRESMRLVWPHVNVGGSYVIEDWAWAHTKPQQESSHPWFDRPALTNLLFELIVDLGAYAHVRSISIDRGRALVVKGSSSDRFLDAGMNRGRDFVHI